jgi:hypothetical protein
MRIFRHVVHQQNHRLSLIAEHPEFTQGSRPHCYVRLNKRTARFKVQMLKNSPVQVEIPALLIEK